MFAHNTVLLLCWAVVVFVDYLYMRFLQLKGNFANFFHYSGVSKYKKAPETQNFLFQSSCNVCIFFDKVDMHISRTYANSLIFAVVFGYNVFVEKFSTFFPLCSHIVV